MDASLTASPVVDDVPVEPDARQVAAAHRGHRQQLDGEGDLQLDRLGHLEIRIEAMPAPEAGRQRKEPIDEPLVLEAAQRRAILLRHPVAAGIEAFAQGLQLLQVCLGNADPVARERTEELRQLMQVRRRLLAGALIDEGQAQSRRVEFDEVADAAEGARIPALVHEGRRERAKDADPSFGADRPDGSTACRRDRVGADRGGRHRVDVRLQGRRKGGPVEGILLAAMRDADAEGRPMAITRPGPVPRPAGIEIRLARPAPAAEVFEVPREALKRGLIDEVRLDVLPRAALREGQQRDLEGAIGQRREQAEPFRRERLARAAGQPRHAGELDGLEHEGPDVGPAPTRDAVPRRRDPFEKPAHRGQVAREAGQRAAEQPRQGTQGRGHVLLLARGQRLRARHDAEDVLQRGGAASCDRTARPVS